MRQETVNLISKLLKILKQQRLSAERMKQKTHRNSKVSGLANPDSLNLEKQGIENESDLITDPPLPKEEDSNLSENPPMSNLMNWNYRNLDPPKEESDNYISYRKSNRIMIKGGSPLNNQLIPSKGNSEKFLKQGENPRIMKYHTFKTESRFKKNHRKNIHHLSERNNHHKRLETKKNFTKEPEHSINLMKSKTVKERNNDPHGFVSTVTPPLETNSTRGIGVSNSEKAWVFGNPIFIFMGVLTLMLIVYLLISFGSCMHYIWSKNPSKKPRKSSKTKKGVYSKLATSSKDRLTRKNVGTLTSLSSTKKTIQNKYVKKKSSEVLPPGNSNDAIWNKYLDKISADEDAFPPGNPNDIIRNKYLAKTNSADEEVSKTRSSLDFSVHTEDWIPDFLPYNQQQNLGNSSRSDSCLTSLKEKVGNKETFSCIEFINTKSDDSESEEREPVKPGTREAVKNHRRRYSSSSDDSTIHIEAPKFKVYLKVQ